VTLQQLSGYRCFNCGTMTPTRPAVECCDEQFAAAVYVHVDAEHKPTANGKRDR